jgi:hypothetical protein
MGWDTFYTIKPSHSKCDCRGVILRKTESGDFLAHLLGRQRICTNVIDE